MEKLLKEYQVARLLNMSLGVVRKWRKEGSGPPYMRIGNNTIRYRESDIKVWLKSKESS